jgi:hypothetical protein
MNIAVTGYVGTGSSAMIDLLREYDGLKIVPEQRASYEHDIFYRSGGLFDLCAIMNQGTSPVCSDKVINRFIDTMENLYRYDYVWYGGYKKLVGEDFMKMVNKFVETISYRFEGSNSTHHLRTRFSPIKAFLQYVSHIVYKKNYMKYGVGYVRDGKPSYVSMPTEEELMQACRELTSNYFDLFKTSSDNCSKVFDHLIWPQQIDNFMKYYDGDNFRVIVMRRDPRDVYLLNKYVWYYSPIGIRTAVPSLRTNTKDFIFDWQRTLRNRFKDENVMQVQFEDLVYDYNNTVKKIEFFLGLSSGQHTRQYKKFDPSKSIENTQVFNMEEDWKYEVEMIVSELSDYLYSFPYAYTPHRKLMFD